jgi:SNF2 family DNA or RNA helicase
MSDNWNLKNLTKAKSLFNKLSETEKLLCSSIANCNMEMDLIQLGWLIRDFAKRQILDEVVSDEQLSDIIKRLIKQNILTENSGRFMINDCYYSAAYYYPLNIDREQFSISMHNYAWSSDFSFEFSNRQNSYSVLLMNLLNGNIDEELFNNFDYSFLGNFLGTPLLSKILEPFDLESFEKLPEKSQLFLLNYAIYYELIRFKKVLSLDEENNIFSYFMKPKWYKSELFLNQSAHNLALYLIFKGNFERAKSYIDVSTSLEAQGINALYVYLFHGSSDSIIVFKNALKELQKQKSKRNLIFFSLADIFYIIALLQDGSSNSIIEAKKYMEKVDKLNVIFKPAYSVINEFYNSRLLGKYSLDNVSNFLLNYNCPFINWLTCFISFWLGYPNKDKYKLPIEKIIDLAKAADLKFVLAEILILAEKLDERISETDKSFLDEWKNNFIIPFVDRVEQKQKWEQVLDNLSKKLNLSISLSESSVRLIWDLRLNFEEHNLKLVPKEQQKLKNGSWSVGKPLSLDVYFEDINPFPNYFSDQDKIIYKILQRNRPWLSGTIDHSWEILNVLINCPNVFLNENFESPIEILEGNPVLMLRSSDEGLYFSFQPVYENESIKPVLENDKRLRIYKFTKNQVTAAEILKEQQFFPVSSLNRIKEILTSLSVIMPVHSTVEGTKTTTPIASIASSSLIYAQLEPIGNGLKVRFIAKPFGPNGPGFIPGSGDYDVFTEIAGQNLHTKRDLSLESKNYNEVLQSSPEFFDDISIDGTAIFNTPDESLELLLRFKDTQNLVIEWPDNTKPKKVISANFSNFSFKVRNLNDWFSLEGELKIDENHVIDLQKILKNYQKGNRFIQIDEDQFLAITEDFKKQIEDIQAFTITDGQQNMFHNSLIKVMDEILSKGGQISFDRNWHEMLNHLKHASEKTFEIPSVFKAELRNYQVDGYLWLSRMAYLGMGACLADDMGLGKTIEALSIITARSYMGPAFVLAPTSVCSNWFNECKRFAPTLNPILFAQSDRKAIIKELAPNDLIICSYGVLQREIEDLSQINWSTVVLDEAQAIKNMATNRSQAAMLLKGKFKMLMTGTPIENHLGELWNLFRFLNPGLLGTINSFNEKFAIPIQSFNDKKAHERLKKLVQPFILRRTKNQVLKDLPPRTEVTLNVELSKEEADLYESLRREALEKINNSKNSKSDSKPMIVLAEIMRLRRLCCNPSLVMPNMQVKSSKLALLESITDDLLASGHKALIFSQFVDHLSIIRKFFDEKGYKYQYLDGSTTIRARNKAIKDFQNGEGDFFLISLKAGGQGINLTAADYVIHMDPWWNPAVEDQASDRAHRIGQTKPVTIYKLITSNTIEEKIVQLHNKKRDLADGLLEGTDISGRISTTELISLINNSAINKLND